MAKINNIVLVHGGFVDGAGDWSALLPSPLLGGFRPRALGGSQRDSGLCRE
jgi:hypothetical protein